MTDTEKTQLRAGTIKLCFYLYTCVLCTITNDVEEITKELPVTFSHSIKAE